jgi:hypothetical protein
MKFTKEITIDWYDNILKAFCFDSDDRIYYCCIVSQNTETDQKIYLCVDIAYLQGYDELQNIIKTDSFKQNWSRLSKLIRLNRINETYLIKAADLRNDQIEFVKYKSNFASSTDVLFGEYPEVIEDAAKIDDWWAVYQKHAINIV